MAAQTRDAALPTQLAAEMRAPQGGAGSAAVLVARFTADGAYCLSGDKARVVRLWNPHQGRLVCSLTGHGREVLGVAGASDNARVASCGGDRAVFVWDVATQRTVRRLTGHTQRVNAVAYARPRCDVLASASYDTSVRLWDLRARSRDALQVLDAFRDSVTSLWLTETEIVAAGVDGQVCAFDLRAGKCVSDMVGSPVTSVVLSHDAKCMLASCTDGAVRMFDRASGKMLGEYTGHKHAQLRMESRFSGDDAVVLSTSENGQVFAWDVLSGEVVARLGEASDTPVTSLDVHPDPEQACMLTASMDGSVQCWKGDKKG